MTQQATLREQHEQRRDDITKYSTHGLNDLHVVEQLLELLKIKGVQAGMEPSQFDPAFQRLQTAIEHIVYARGLNNSITRDELRVLVHPNERMVG